MSGAELPPMPFSPVQQIGLEPTNGRSFSLTYVPFLILFGAFANPTDGHDLILFEADLVTGDDQFVVSEGERQGRFNTRTISVVVGVLNEFKNEMGVARIKIFRETGGVMSIGVLSVGSFILASERRFVGLFSNRSEPPPSWHRLRSKVLSREQRCWSG